MNLDRVFTQTFVIESIAVFGEIDVLEGPDDEADVLREDGRVAGKARRLSCRVGRVENLCVSVLDLQWMRANTDIVC